MQNAIIIASERDAYNFLSAYLRKEWPGEIGAVKLDGWPRIVIHLDGPKYHATITPTVMKGFMALQKEIYRSLSIAKFNVPRTGRLTRQERRDLELEVKVSNGSSTYEVDVQTLLEKLIELSVGRMDSNDLMAVLITFGVLFFGTSAFKSYLENRRVVREQELKSDEQRKLIEALQFTTQQETERAKIITDLAKQNPRIENLRTYSEDARLALLRSVTSSDSAEIQGVEIDGDAAEVLAQNARVRSKQVRLDGLYRIQVVDSADPKEFRIKVLNVDSRESFVARVEDDSLAPENRGVLQHAEWSKKPVFLKINAKEARDVIRDAVIIGVKEYNPDDVNG